VDFMKGGKKEAEMFLDIFVWFWHIVGHQGKKRWQHWVNYKKHHDAVLCGTAPTIMLCCYTVVSDKVMGMLPTNQPTNKPPPHTHTHTHSHSLTHMV